MRILPPQGSSGRVKKLHTRELNHRQKMIGARRRKMFLEQLETRSLMAVLTWDGSANNLWSNPANWAGDVAPIAGDDLVFPAGAGSLANVNDLSAGTRFNTILIQGSGYNITGAAIELNGGLTANNSTGTNTFGLDTTIINSLSFHAANAGTTLNLSGSIHTGLLIGTGQIFGTTALNFDGEGAINATGVIDGGASLTKLGDGSLILSGANTYQGITDIRQGVLVANNNSALGLATTGETQIQAGAALQIQGNRTIAENFAIREGGVGFGNGTDTTALGAIRSINGVNTLTGNIDLAGGNNLIGVNAGSSLIVSGVIANALSATNRLIKVGDGTLQLAGTADNVFRGETRVLKGTLELNKSPGVNAIGGDLIIGDNLGGDNGAVVRLLANDQIPHLNFFGVTLNTITLNSSGLLDFNGNTDTVGNLVLTTGTTYSSDIDLNGGTLIFGGSGLTVNAFQGSSGATPAATIQDGTFNLGTIFSGAGGGTTKTFTIADTQLTNIATDLDISASVTGTSDISITRSGGGTLRLGGSANTFSGPFIWQGGIIEVASNNALGTGLFAWQNDSDTLKAIGNRTIGNPISIDTNLSNFIGSDSLTLTGNVTLTTNAATRTLRVMDPAQTITFAGVIGEGIFGTVNLAKGGRGTLALTGANTYSGTTTIANDGGTLALRGGGSILNSSAVTVGIGGILKIDNNSGGNLTDRINDATGISLNGKIHFVSSSAADSSEYLGTLTTNGSVAMTIEVEKTSPAGFSSALTFNSMVNGTGSDRTMSFIGTGTPLSDSTAAGANRLSFANNPGGLDDGILQMGLVQGPGGALDFATYGSSPEGFAIIPLPAGAYVTDINQASPTSNVRVSANTALTASKSVNAILIDPNVSLTGAGATLTVNSGRFVLAGGSSLGATQLNTGGGAITVPSGTATISSNIFSGNVQKAGRGMLVLSGDSQTGGGYNINEGILEIQSSTALGSPAGTTTVRQGATLQLNGNLTIGLEPLNQVVGVGFSPNAPGSGLDTYASAIGAVRNVSGNSTWAGTFSMNGDVADLSPLLAGYPAVPTSTVAFVDVAAGSLAISGAVSGSELIKRGSGQLEFSGILANSQSITRVLDGTLLLNKEPGINAVTNLIEVGTDAVGAPNATLKLGGSDQIADNVGVRVHPSGLFDLNGNSELIGGNFELMIGPANAGDVNIGAGGTLTTNVNTTVFTVGAGAAVGSTITGGTLALQQFGVISGAGTRTFQVNDGANGDDLTLTSMVSDGTGLQSVGITKTGFGTLVLGGTTANTFTGTTSVNEGTLALNKPAGVAAVAGPLVIGLNNDVNSGFASSDVLELRQADQIPDFLSTALLINATGLLDLNGNNETLGVNDAQTALSMQAGATIDMDGAQLTLLGNIATSAANGAGLWTPVTAPRIMDGTLNLGSVIRSIDTGSDRTELPYELEISANLVGSGGIVFNPTTNNNGTLLLSGNNGGFSGDVVRGAAGGNLAIGSDTALGTGRLVLNGGHLATYGGKRTIANRADLAGTIAFLAGNGAAGTGNLGGGGNDLTFTGPVNMVTGGITAIVATAGQLEFTGGLGEIYGVSAFNKSGYGTAILSSYGSYSNGTTINTNGGAFILRDQGTSINNNFNVNVGGTLQIDNRAGANLSNRLGDTAQIQLSGGILALVGATGGVSTEAAGQLLASNDTDSQVQVLASPVGGSNATWRFTNYARQGTNGNMLTFIARGVDIGATTGNKVVFNTAPGLTNSILSTTVIINTTGPEIASIRNPVSAAVDPYYNALEPYTAITAPLIGGLGTFATTLVGATATSNVKLSGNQTLTGGTVSANAVLLAGNNITVGESAATTLALTSNFLGSYGTGNVINTTGLTLAAEGLIINTGDLTINSAIGGAGTNLTKNGSGVLIMGGAGANAFAGATRVNEGIFRATKPTAFGTTAGNVNVAYGATVELTGGIVIPPEQITLNGNGENNAAAVPLRNLAGTNEWQGTVQLNSNRTAIETALGTSLIFSGVVAGNSFNKIGEGTLQFAGGGANTYANNQLSIIWQGALELNKTAGVVAVNSQLAVGDYVGAPNADVLRLLQSNQLADNGNPTLRINPAGLWDLNNNSESFVPGATVNSLELWMGPQASSAITTGTGTLTLGSTGAFASNINANNVQSGGLAPPIVISGNLALTAGAAQTITLNDSSGVNDMTISAAISGGTALTKTGNGRLTLSGDNGTYTGSITLAGGETVATHVNALGNVGNNTTVNSGVSLLFNGISTAEPLNLNGVGFGGQGAVRSLGGTNTWSGNIALAGTATFGVDAGRLVLSGVISGGAGVQKIYNGTMELAGTGANTFTGTLQVQEGTLELNKTGAIAVPGRLEAGNDSGTGGNPANIVRWLQSEQVGSAEQIIANTEGLIDLNGKTETFSNNIANGIFARLGQTSAGRWDLGGGTLIVSPTGNAFTLGTNSTGNLINSPAGFFGNGNISLTNANAGNFNVSDALNAIDVEIAATITNTAGVNILKAGGGALALSGNNSATLTGHTLNLSAGLLALGSGNALGNAASALNVTASTFLITMPGVPLVDAHNITLNSDLTIRGDSNVALNGVITNSGGNRTLTANLNGPRTLTLGGTINLSESATARTLNLNANTFGGGVNNTIVGGDVLVTGQIVNGNGSNGGVITKAGPGLVVLSNNTNTYNGNTNVNAGVVRVTANGALGGAISEVQTFSVNNGVGPDGSFTISFGTSTIATTTALAYVGSTPPADATVAAALNALPNVGPMGGVIGVVSTTAAGITTYTLTFGGTFTGLDVAQVTVTPTAPVVVSTAPATTVGGSGHTPVAAGATLQVDPGLTMTEHIRVNGTGFGNFGALRLRDATPGTAETTTISSYVILDTPGSVGVDAGGVNGDRLITNGGLLSGSQPIKLGAGTWEVSGATDNIQNPTPIVTGGWDDGVELRAGTMVLNKNGAFRAFGGTSTFGDGGGGDNADRVVLMGSNTDMLNGAANVVVGASGFLDLQASAATVVETVPGVAATTNEKQTITLGTLAPSYTLTFNGQTTAAIATTATATTIDGLLEGLSTIGVGGVDVTGPVGGPYVVEFTGARGLADQPLLIVGGEAIGTLTLNRLGNVAGDVQTLAYNNLNLGGTVTVNSNYVIANTAGGTVTTGTTAPATIAGNLSLGGATRAFDVHDSFVLNPAEDMVVPAIISGSTFGVTKQQSGTLALTAANTYTGTTTVAPATLDFNASFNNGSNFIIAGTLVARGAGTFGTGAVNVNGGGTLVLDNTAGNADRIANAATLTLSSGNLIMIGNVAGSNETITTLTLNSTDGVGQQNRVTVNSAAGGVTVLQATNLTRGGSASAEFVGVGADLGNATNSRIQITGAAGFVNSVLPWATITGPAGFDLVTDADGASAAAPFFIGRVPIYSTDINAGGIVRLNGVTQTMTADRTVDAILLENGAVVNGAFTLSVGTAANPGLVVTRTGNNAINATGSATQPGVQFAGRDPLFLTDGTSTLTVSGNINATATLRKERTGTLILSGDNDDVAGRQLTGATSVNAGTLIASNGDSLGTEPGGTVTIQRRATLVLDAGATGIALGNKPITINGLGLNDDGTGALRIIGTNTVSIGTGATAVNFNSNPAIVTVGTGSILSLNANVGTGGNQIIKRGGGEMIYTGGTANSVTGQLSVNEGTVTLDKTGAVLAVNGAIVVDDLGIYDGIGGSLLRYATTGTSTDMIGNVNITVNYPGVFDINGKTDTTTGTLTIQGGSYINTAGGGTFQANAVTMTGGTLNTSTGTLNLNGTLTYNNGLSPGGLPVISGNLNLLGAARTFAVNDGYNATNDLQIDAVVTNGRVVKTGNGGLLMTNAANTFLADVDEQQAFTVNAGVTTFTIGFNAFGATLTTIGIPYSASTPASAVQAALERLSNIQPGNVLVTGAVGGPYNIQFTGALSGIDFGTLTFTPTGGTITAGANINGAHTWDVQGAGILATSNDAALGTGRLVMNGNTAALIPVGNRNIANPITFFPGLNHLLGGRRDFTGNSSLTLSGPVSFATPATAQDINLQVDDPLTNVIISGVVGGGNSTGFLRVQKTGAGTLQLTNANTFVAPLNIPTGGGVVRISNSAGLGLQTNELSFVQDVGTAFTLTFNGQTTASIPTGSTAATVAAALNALPTIGGVNGSVTVTGSGIVNATIFDPFIIEFHDSLAGQDVVAITATGATVLAITRNGGGTIVNANTALELNGSLNLGEEFVTFTGIGALGRTGTSATFTGAVRALSGTSMIGTGKTPIQSAGGNGQVNYLGAAAGASLIINGGIFQPTALPAAQFTNLNKVGPGTLEYQGTTPNTYGTTGVLEGTLQLNKAPGVNAIPMIFGTAGTIVVGDNIGAASSDQLVLMQAEQIPDASALTVVGTGQVSTLVAQAASVNNEVQQVTIGNAAPTGQYRLVFNGQTTGDIAFGAALSVIQAALNALPNIGGAGGSVVVQGSGSGQNNFYTITFLGTLAGVNQPQIKVVAGTTPFAVATVTVTTVTPGGLAGRETIGAPTLRIAPQGAGNISLQPTSTLALNGDVTVDSYGALPPTSLTGAAIAGGNLDLRPTSANGATINRNFNVNFDAPATDDLTISSKIVDTANGAIGSINKAGAANSRLVIGGGGANTFVGQVNVASGNLAITSSVALGSVLTDEVQTYVINNTLGNASGTYTITTDQGVTVPLAFNASADEVQAALETLYGVGNVKVVSSVNGNTNTQYSIRWLPGARADYPITRFTPTTTNVFNTALSFADVTALDAANGPVAGTLNFEGLWSGFVTVGAADPLTWSFGTNGDDGTAIMIDLNNDGIYTAAERFVYFPGFHGQIPYTSNVTFPAPGNYRIAIAYMQQGGGGVMEARFAKGANATYAEQAIINPGLAAQAGIWSDELSVANQLTNKWFNQAPTGSGADIDPSIQPIVLSNNLLVNATFGAVTTNQEGGQPAGTTVAAAAALELRGGAGMTVVNEPLTLNGVGILNGATPALWNNAFQGVVGTGNLRNVSGDNVWQGNLSGFGNITLVNTAAIGVDAGSLTSNGTTGNISNNVTTASALIKTGTGVLETGGSAANQYTGNTYVQQGTYRLNKQGNQLAIAGSTLFIGDGLGADNSDVVQYAATAGGNQINDIVVRMAATGLLDLNGISDSILVSANNPFDMEVGPTASSTINLGAGTLTLPNGTNNNLTVVGNGGTTVASPPADILATTGALNFAGVTRTIDVRETNAPVELSIAAAIANGALGITKAGRGTLALSGNNNFTGTTTVNADSGTLLANTPATVAASAYTIGAGSTLGGTGTITGAVTLGAVASNLTVGGILNPGSTAPAPNNTGILTVNNNVTFSAGSLYSADINGTTAGTQYDQLVVGPTGAVTITGIAGAAPNNTAMINGTTGNGFQPVNGVDSFKLIDKAGAVLISGPPLGSFLSQILPQPPLSSPSTVLIGGKTYSTTYNVAAGLNDGNDFVLQAVATTRVWDGEGNLLAVPNNNWSLGANWVGDFAPFSGDSVQFGDQGNTRESNNNDFVGYTLGAITFNKTVGAAYSLNGNAVTLNALGGGITQTGPTLANNVVNLAGITLAANPQTFTNASINALLSINSPVNGAQTLNLTGLGDLTFNGAIGGVTPLVAIAATGVDDLTFANTISTTGNVTQTAGTGLTVLSGGNVGGALTMMTENFSLAGSTLNVTGTATLTATVSNIADGNGAANNITAPVLVATAVTGIDLDTTIVDLTATNTGAGNVQIDEANALNILGLTVANGNATINALGALTDGATAVTNVSGIGSFTGTTVTLGDAAGDAFNLGSLTFASAGAVNITEDSATQLAGTSAANSLVLTSAGALTNTGTANVTVTGNAAFSAPSVTLGNQAGDLFNFGSLTFTSAGAVNIAEDSTTNLAGASTALSLVLSSTAGITNNAASSVTVTNNATLNAPSITLGSAAGDTVNFGTVTFTTTVGGIDLTEDSSIDLLGASLAAGPVLLTVVDQAAAGQNITLPAGSTLSSTLSSITLNAGDNVTLAGNVSAGTTLNVNVDNSVADVGTGGVVAVSGAITTTGGATFTGNADNDSFTLKPQAGSAFTVNGNAPTAFPGDVLNLDLTGTVNPVLTLGGLGSGTWTFSPPLQSVTYSSIEQVNSVGANYNLVLDTNTGGFGNTGVDDQILLRRSGPDFIVERTGLAIAPDNDDVGVIFQGAMASILSFQYIGSNDNDIVTVSDSGGLFDFSSTVPLVSDNPNGAGIAEFSMNGGGGSDRLIYNLSGASVAQNYAIGTGSGVGSSDGETETISGGVTLVSYFTNVELAQRTGIGATPGVLSVIGDQAANSMSVVASGTATQVTAAGGYTPFEFPGNNYSGVAVSGGQNTDTLQLLSIGSGQTNPLATTLNGDAAADILRVQSTSGNTGVVTLNGGAGNDLFQLFNAANTVDSIFGQVVVDGTDGNVAGNNDTLTIIDTGDVTADTVRIDPVNPGVSADYRVEGINSTAGNDVIFRNIDTLNYTGTQGNDTIDGRFATTVPVQDLSTVNLSGWLGADQFLLFTSDQAGGSGAGLTPTGTSSGVAVVNLYGDSPGNPNLTDGNDVFGETPPGLVGTGSANVGLVVPDSVRSIRPSASTAINIDGGQPTGPANPTADTVGDVFNVDISGLPAGSALILPTVGGVVAATGLEPLAYTQIEDINLVYNHQLINVQMGDTLVVGTAGPDLIQFMRNQTPTNPNLARVRVNTLVVDLTLTGKTLTFGGASNDYITQANVDQPAEMYGEAGNDYISGAMANDFLVGGLGDDQINASGGDNIVWGDDSPSTLVPVPQDLAIGGDDYLSGLGGNDVFYGGGGNDQVSAGSGNDYANGGLGDDVLGGDNGDDRLYGGGGNDTIGGGAGNDLISAGAGNDLIHGDSGDDVIFGGTGEDQMSGDSGNDIVITGSVANETSSFTSVASVGNYNAASYTSPTDNDAALLNLLTQWSLFGSRSSLAPITHDGVNDNVFGGTNDDDFCWEAADIADDFPAVAPADFNAIGMGNDERFGPT